MSETVLLYMVSGVLSCYLVPVYFIMITSWAEKAIS